MEASTPCIENENECPVCAETLSKPKVLSCSHVFCEECVGTWIENQAKRDQRKTLVGIECPLCRRMSKPPNSVASPQEWASMLPNANVCVAKEGEVEIFCNPCRSTREQKPARFFCIECNEYLCVDCQKTHRKLKISRTHKTIETTKHSAANIQTYVEYNKLLKCDLHTEKNIEFFCKDHGEMFCSTCAFLHHRTCSDVIEIEGNSDKVRPGKPLLFTSELFKILRNHVQDLIVARNRYGAEIENRERHMKDQLREMKTSLIRKFEKIAAKVVKEFTEKTKKFQHANNDHLERLSVLKNKLESVVKTTDEIVEMKLSISDPKYTVATHKLEHKFSAFCEEIQILGLDKFRSFVFRPSQNFISGVSDVRVLGQVAEEGSEVKMPSWPDKKLFGERNFKLSKNKLATPRYREVPFFSSICNTTDSNVLLADQNNKLVLVCLKGRKLEVVISRLKTQPFALVCTSETLYVSFPSEQKIRKYLVNQEFEKSGEINTESECYGLGQVGEEERVVCSLCDEESWALVTYNGEGLEIKRLDSADGRSFRTLYHFLIMGNTIYQSSQEDNKLNAFHLEDGTLIFEYAHDELKCPGGIHRDVEWNIYVCGMLSDNIHVVSKTGSPVRIIQLHLNNPTGIFLFDNGEDALVLGDAKRPGPFLYELCSD